ncbi:MAG: WYL domain-containing protein [Chitinophagaceae bacterium]|nr:WYL domain-containing protein [Chitinophagaceae bacterium]
MPANKQLLSRIRVIDTCLGDSMKKYWSKKHLIERIESSADIRISERTLDGDIEKMRHSSQLKYYAPIKYSKPKDGYYYAEEGYSINNLPLNEKDIQALEFATTTLSQYKKIKILADFAGTVDKLINVINQIKYTDHEALFSFIDFEKAPFSKGTEHLNVLVDAIKNKRVIEIVYQRFDDTEAKSHIICPYLLKEYRNRWYLLGHHTKKKVITTFGLDRISVIKLVQQVRYTEAQNFNPESYFKNTIGITYQTGRPHVVELAFTNLQGQYIKTQYLHETQEILIDNEKELRIRMNVVINYELSSTILSYGESVKVIKPLSLKNDIKRIITNTIKQYRK